MDELLKKIAPQIVSCRLGGIPLEHELRSLSKVYGCRANEATVFHCARIHEAIFKDASRTVFRAIGANLSAMESDLFAYNFLPLGNFCFSKGLRLLGNEVRHDMAPVSDDEADLAILFLVFLLRWYLCELVHGAGQPEVLLEQPSSVSGSLALAWPPYLGLNAATTSLWLKKTQLAGKIAVAVKALLEDRRGKVQRLGRDLSYWDSASLAEINLLLGDAASAAALYLKAFRDDAEQRQNIEASRGQLQELLPFLSLDAAGAEEVDKVLLHT